MDNERLLQTVPGAMPTKVFMILPSRLSVYVNRMCLSHKLYRLQLIPVCVCVRCKLITCLSQKHRCWTYLLLYAGYLYITLCLARVLSFVDMHVNPSFCWLHMIYGFVDICNSFLIA
jgi:hypothetical protein